MTPYQAYSMATFALLVAVPSVSSQAAGEVSTAAPPTCDRPEHRQFDFWVGDWNVTNEGKRAGTNLVTLEESGCLVHEHWTGIEGGTGQSFNYFDRSDGKWHQIWVSSTGSILNLSGEYLNRRLVLTGERKPRDGNGMVQHKLTFVHNEDGSVRQVWHASKDGGHTWSTVFDGLYTKK